MGSIAEHIHRIAESLPKGMTLAAVSKYHPVEAIAEAYEAGQRVFCESRAAELAEKAQALPSDIEWHFIGHLQTNKVKTVVPWVHTIQSIDSERVLKAVDAEATRLGRRISALLQVHVAAEETKYGLTPEETLELAERIVPELKSVDIAGVMGMATNTDSAERIAADFEAIKTVFDKLSAGIMNGKPSFRIISMGMSHDYESAIAHGSNMVRIGTSIFGEREY